MLRPVAVRTTLCLSAALAAGACQANDDAAPADGETDTGDTDTVDTAAPWIIDGTQLEAMRDDPTTRILDARDETVYLAGHVPGAVLLDPASLRATVDGVVGQVASVADVEAAFSGAGLTAEHDVVVYGDSFDATEVARMVWTLAYHGHRGRVWMLDGGFQRWSEDGRPLETGAPPIRDPNASYESARVEQRRVDAAWVLAHLDDPEVQLFDARSTLEFDTGHIPGAMNVEWTQTLDGDDLFHSASTLRSLHGDPDPSATLVTYCQTGSRASVTWLVLTALGYEDVRLYDGSWTEWGEDPTLPREP